MSLNWSLEKVKNWKEYCYYKDDDGNDNLSSLTNALIWLTIPVRLGEITDKNWREFWTRVHVVEHVYGCSLRNNDGTDHPITPEDVKAHIGLNCNVADESNHKFHVAMGKALRDEANRWRQRWEKEEEKVGLPRESDAVA